MSGDRLLDAYEWVGYDLNEIAEMAALLEQAAKDAEARATAKHEQHRDEALLNPFASVFDGTAPSYAAWASELWRYKMAVPQHARRAALILVCSGIEGTLLRFCEWLQDEKGLTNHVSILRERGLERVKRYATDAGFPFPVRRPEWAELVALATVRNCLVHRLALAKSGKDGESIRRYAKQRKEFLAVEENGEVIIYEGLPAHAASVGRAFLDHLVSLCPAPASRLPPKQVAPQASALERVLLERVEKGRGE